MFIIILIVRIERYWSSVANRKKFFLNFAKEKNFDPHVPENWYPWKQKVFEERKVIHPFIYIYII